MEELITGTTKIEQVLPILANEKATTSTKTITPRPLPRCQHCQLLPWGLPGDKTILGRGGKRPRGRVRSRFQPRSRRPNTVNAACVAKSSHALHKTITPIQPSHLNTAITAVLTNNKSFEANCSADTIARRLHQSELHARIQAKKN
jgi:hypothetical protein